MHPSRRRSLALALAEAVHSGIPLGPLPPDFLPRSVAEGSRIAALMLEALDLAPCGLRLGPAPGGGPMLTGPMLEARLLRQGTPVALAMLHHPLASPAVLGVLAADLPCCGDHAPVFATLHPALDIAGWRLHEVPAESGLAVADLAGLGLLVTGRGKAPEQMPSRMGFGPAGARRRSVAIDLRPALAAAAAAARRAGGLPRGAVLVAVIGPGVVPVAGDSLSASFTGLGTVRVAFA